MEELEQKFITDYNSERTEVPQSHSENVLPPEKDPKAPQADVKKLFQEVNVPLHDKNAWDDSGLIDAWNQAVKQREASRNELFDESIKEGEVLDKDLGRKPTFDRTDTPSLKGGLPRSPPLKRKRTDKKGNKIPTEAEFNDHTYPHSGYRSYYTEYQTQPCPMMPPSALLPSHSGTGNQDLDNLVLAWYYAGYYSALYKSRSQ